jgi:hypothetical protein
VGVPDVEFGGGGKLRYTNPPMPAFVMGVFDVVTLVCAIIGRTKTTAMQIVAIETIVDVIIHFLKKSPSRLMVNAIIRLFTCHGTVL